MFLKQKFTFFLLLFIPILFSCGISDIPILFGATISRISPGVFSIRHNTSNSSDSFIGYNVYYKLYSSAEAATIAADNDYMTDTTRNPSPAVITGRGFRKLLPVTFNGVSFSNDDNEDTLLTPRPRSASKTYYIDFSAGSEVYGSNVPKSSFIIGVNDDHGYQALLIEGSSTRVIHRRQNGDVNTPFFNTISLNKYKATDTDIVSMVGSTFTTGDSLRIVLAVIPFGLDFQSVQRIYGEIDVTTESIFDYTQTP